MSHEDDSKYAKRIYAAVTLNDQHKMKLKVNTGADIYVQSRQMVYKTFHFLQTLNKVTVILKDIVQEL